MVDLTNPPSSRQNPVEVEAVKEVAADEKGDARDEQVGVSVPESNPLPELLFSPAVHMEPMPLEEGEAEGS